MKKHSVLLIILIISAIASLFALILFFIHQSLSIDVQLLLGVTVILFSIYIFLDPIHFLNLFHLRQVRFGTRALLMGSIFIGILVLINMIASIGSLQWDITSDKLHTLNPTTLKIISEIKYPVTIQSFFTKSKSNTATNQLLDSYRQNSNGIITIQSIDPDQDPVSANHANVFEDGSVVITMNGRSELITSIDEEHISAALLHLLDPSSRVIYFTTGHGEGSLVNETNRAFTTLARVLEKKNYTVKTLDLLSSTSVPSDALCVIIAGPTKSFSFTEAHRLDTYLSNGGSLVGLFEPFGLTDIDNTKDPLILLLQNNWGIQFYSDIIADPSATLPMATTSDPGKYPVHPILSNLTGTYLYFFTSQTVVPTSSSTNLTDSILVVSNSKAWGETNPLEIQQGKLSFESTDIPGPLPLAVALENQKSTSRIVIVGDSDFAADNYINNYGNLNFIINSIDWASKSTSGLNLIPQQTIRRLFINPSAESMNIIFIVSVIFFPSIVFITGIIVWAVRRRVK